MRYLMLDVVSHALPGQRTGLSSLFELAKKDSQPHITSAHMALIKPYKSKKLF